MVQAAFDWTALREPNLLIPGGKPNGPVKIDWRHSLTLHLTNVYGIGTNLGSCLRDRAGGAHGVNSGLTTQQGSLYNDGSANYATIGSTTSFEFHKGDSRWTVLSRFRLNDYTADALQIIVGSSISSAQEGFALWYDNRDVTGTPRRLTQYASTGVASHSMNLYHDNAISDNAMHTYVARANGDAAGEDGELWIDGTYFGTTSNTIVFTQTTDDQFRAAQLLAVDGSFPFDGQVPLIMLFNDALSDSACRELSADPYQFFMAL